MSIASILILSSKSSLLGYFWYKFNPVAQEPSLMLQELVAAQDSELRIGQNSLPGMSNGHYREKLISWDLLSSID